MIPRTDAKGKKGDEHMEDVITVSHLNLVLNKDPILKDVTIGFEQGKIHGIVGKNGSGKTMLFKCICGFVVPSSGEIVVQEKRIGKDCDFPQDIGIIIENPGFLPYYSGYKNLHILASLRGKISKEEIRESIRKVGLDPENKKAVRKYSMGMRQRLGLAQAIMEDPSLLVLDEPMNGLDKAGIEDMRNLLKSFRDDGKTILISSHNHEDIDVLCDTVSEMDLGVLERQS